MNVSFRFSLVSCIILLETAVADQTGLIRNDVETDTNILIGGAGYSGISAANMLHDNDVSFIIVEASERIGGRMFEVSFGENDAYTVEAGAQWINGLKNNPAYDQATQDGLGGILQDFTFVVYDERGKKRPEESLYKRGSYSRKLDDAWEEADELSKQCLQFSSGDLPFRPKRERFCNANVKPRLTLENVNDVSISDLLKSANGFNPPDEDEPSLARVCDVFFNDFTIGEKPELTSGADGNTDELYSDFSNDDMFVLDSRGYSWLVKSQAANFLNTSVNTNTEKLYDDPRLALQTKILKIRWDPDGETPVHVSVCKTAKTSPQNSPNRYDCLLGSGSKFTVTANEFISTFSLAVLQESLEEEENQIPLDGSENKAPRFDPPLSSVPQLATSLKRNGLGVYTKVFFQFPIRFWGEKEEFYLSAYSSKSHVGDFAPVWFTYDFPKGKNKRNYYPGSNIIMLFATGERARELETFSNDEVIDQLLPVLNKMFKRRIRRTLGRKLEKNDILDFFMTRWSTDPLFRGGFSNWRVGFSANDHANISKRYGNLVFSGEHTCRRHYGFTHGAKLSGQRSVSMLLNDRYGLNLDAENLCDDS